MNKVWQSKNWLKKELKIKSIGEISRDQGLSYSGIYYWVKKYNLESKFGSGKVIYGKLTQQEAKIRFEKKGWKLIGKYTGNKDKVKAICPYCKQIKMVMPVNVYRGLTKSCGCVMYKLTAQTQSTSIKENSLGYLYPEIAKLYSKNNKKSVFKIYPYSNKKYLWICEEYEYDHEYTAFANRIMDGARCPFCAGQKVLEGFNDLASGYPNLKKEWNYSKNKLKPNQVTRHSGRKIWWVCSSCNYEWKNTVAHRVDGECCPSCSPKSHGEEVIKEILIQQNVTFEAEKRFPDCRNKQPLRFDFYLPSYNLLIEYNGEQHYKSVNKFGGKKGFEQRQLHDQIKKDWAKQNNIRLLIIPYWDRSNIPTILENNLKVRIE